MQLFGINKELPTSSSCTILLNFNTTTLQLRIEFCLSWTALTGWSLKGECFSCEQGNELERFYRRNFGVSLFMERESNILLVSSQAPPVHPSNQKRRMKRKRLHIEKRCSKTGLWIFLLNCDKHKMNGSRSKKQIKETKQRNRCSDQARGQHNRAVMVRFPWSARNLSYFQTPVLALGSTQSPLRWGRGFFPLGLRRTGHENDYSLP